MCFIRSRFYQWYYDVNIFVKVSLAVVAVLDILLYQYSWHYYSRVDINNDVSKVVLIIIIIVVVFL